MHFAYAARTINLLAHEMKAVETIAEEIERVFQVPNLGLAA